MAAIGKRPSCADGADDGVGEHIIAVRARRGNLAEEFAVTFGTMGARCERERR
jgi:hypothetical protein